MSAKLKFTKEQVVAAYAGKATIKDAMRTLGCSYGPLVKLMAEYGIQRKQISQLRDRAWFYEQIVEQGRTQRDVAAELGTTPGNVASYCRTHNLYPKQSQSDATKAWLSRRYPNGRYGPEAPNWRGGRRSTSSGYVRIYMPEHPHATNGWVYEHRHVMEQKIGRLLKPGEIVDHVDCNKSNNHPENLRLHPSRSEHIKDHFNGRHESRDEVARLKSELAQYRERYGPLEETD